jgi:hypothetical protein
MTNPNRLASGYEPSFDIDAEVGRQGELFVLDVADSLKHGRGEVKNQQKALTTGNVWIEYHCLRRNQPSGIDATSADYWAFTFGIPPAIALVAETQLVRDVHERALREGYSRSMTRGSHPTKGTVVPTGSLLRWLIEAHNARLQVAA